MHVIDTLAAAGAERVAVNIVNHLPRGKYAPYLCTTRADGPLDELVASDVGRLRLQRTSRFDFDAVRRVRRFIRLNDIRILHTHSSSLFIARLAAMGTEAKIVWHAHYGRYALEDQRAYRYRLATRGIGGVFTVNREMAEWCSRRLRVPSKSVWYLPNPVSLNESAIDLKSALPGTKGTRIICLATFRPEKDHFTLVRAMSRVVRDVPGAHLLLAGRTNDRSYKERLERQLLALGLENNVSVLGERHDVSAILHSCDIGVLSSISEGLPMSLLEYGAAGLPAIATEVGQCSDVLDYGRAGVLVPASNVEALAKAMTLLLQSLEARRTFANRLHDPVSKTFSSETVVRQISDIYEKVLEPNAMSSRPKRPDVYFGYCSKLGNRFT
jgi:glycosyltransferase involved in cell wall biosynthesis